MTAGFFVWILIFFFLPKPTRIYVFGHEFTHAIWTWILGGKVKGMKIGSKEGYVLSTKPSFLISLSPYFFPIYTFLVALIFFIGNFFWNWSSYYPYFYFLIGVAYAFHITMTFYTLKTEQTDLSSQSYAFSASIIFIGNMLVLLIGIPLIISKGGILNSLNVWIESSIEIYQKVFDFFFKNIIPLFK